MYNSVIRWRIFALLVCVGMAVWNYNTHGEFATAISTFLSLLGFVVIGTFCAIPVVRDADDLEIVSELGPDDIVVVKYSFALSVGAKEGIQKRLQAVFGNTVVVLDAGASLQVVPKPRREECTEDNHGSLG